MRYILIMNIRLIFISKKLNEIRLQIGKVSHFDPVTVYTKYSPVKSQDTSQNDFDLFRILLTLFFCHSESKTFIIEDGCVVGLGNLMTSRFDRRLVGKLDSTSQLRRNTFFTYEYLYHFGMVDAEGKCRGLAGIATHLVRCEPANLSKSFCFRYFIC